MLAPFFILRKICNHGDGIQCNIYIAFQTLQLPESLSLLHQAVMQYANE
jgi:hypothetical protein